MGCSDQVIIIVCLQDIRIEHHCMENADHPPFSHSFGFSVVIIDA
jgi:hypothetical protein